jgi:Mg/Co/Ni transporter MgtE
MNASGRIRRVPIVDENNQLCGILSFDDLIVLLATELDNLKRAVQEGVRIEQETESAAPVQP